LPKTSLIIRLAAIGAVVAGIAGLFAYAGGWLTPGTLTPASMIDTFEKVGRLHPGFRRNHAKPDPARMKAFLAGYPETAKAMQLIGNQPVSSGFDNSTYNGLDAFRFINASGAVTPVRWSMVPVHPFEPISTTDPGKADNNYLFDALIAAIHSHPLQWHLVVTIGQPGDPTNDATIPWPPDRQQTMWAR
jgi:catalase